ncbi:MAG: hypothetical protein HW380_3830 [Magnetococcales bacterium]|nr:hypothetical protein [Magnetococcales bacterium]
MAQACGTNILYGSLVAPGGAGVISLDSNVSEKNVKLSRGTGGMISASVDTLGQEIPRGLGFCPQGMTRNRQKGR